MKIAIIEDKKEDQEQLQALLEEYCSSHSIAAEITCFSSGDELLKDYQPGRFQCMFLDIYMDGTDGMELARRIYRRDPACRIIFATASTTHAVASYEVHAAWYLTKPINTDRLIDAMDVVCRDVLRSQNELTIHINGTEIHLRFDDIYHMDCTNRQAKLHLKERTLEVDESVSDLIHHLSADQRFLMCNRSTMVNMDHIELVEDHDFRMKNATTVPIRQRGRAALKKEFLAWSLRELCREKKI